MLNINLICIGRLKEKYYEDAQREFLKRLGPYCRLSVTEIQEARLPENPSKAGLDAALSLEAAIISEHCAKNGAMIAMCIEGDVLDSTAFAAMLQDFAVSGASKIDFVVGGSFGLADSIKSRAARKLSMSRMTFPHNLARVMLLEQIYRAFKIAEGGKYHK